MNFDDIIFERDDYEDACNLIEYFLAQFSKTDDINEKNKYIKQINSLRSSLETGAEVCFIRFSRNINDEFYAQEQDYIDRNISSYERATIQVAKNICRSKNRNLLEERWGSHLFEIYELKKNIYNSSVFNLNVTENKIITDFNKHVAESKVNIFGNDVYIKSINKFLLSSDKNVRMESLNAINKFFEDNKNYYDKTFDDLLNLRHKISRRLGFRNYSEYSISTKLRVNYGYEEIEKFRGDLIEYIVPIMSELAEIQKSKLKVTSIKPYDQYIYTDRLFPQPDMDSEVLFDKLINIFKDISTEIYIMLKQIKDGKFYDLNSRKNKLNMGYCSFLYDHGMPFLFMNYDPSIRGYQNLVNLISYAIVSYLNRDQEIIEYSWPGNDITEFFPAATHFLLSPYVNKIFEKDYDTYGIYYKIHILWYALSMSLYDEYQFICYGDVKMTAEQRKDLYLSLYEKYFPYMDISDCKGNIRQDFYKNNLMFTEPFYSIDYSLGTISALEFYNTCLDDEALALEKFKELCMNSGKLSYLDALSASGFKNLFESGSVASIVTEYGDRIIEEYKNI